MCVHSNTNVAYALAALRSALEAPAKACIAGDFAAVSLPIDGHNSSSLESSLPHAMAGSSPRRRASFSAGRVCAQRALAALRAPDTAVSRDQAGAPIWPIGFAGSISHTDTVVAAIVARNPPIAGIGIDLEHDRPMESAEMCRLICRPGELAPLHHAKGPGRLHQAMLLFVIKEAVYKLHSPLGGPFLDFHDVHVQLDWHKGRFVAKLVTVGKQGEAGSTFAGAFSRRSGLIMAVTA